MLEGFFRGQRPMADRLLRWAARAVAAAHYRFVHRTIDPFVPGTTPIPYARRVYDEREMQALMDAALDFWLTEGRFARQFREDLCAFLGVPGCILANSGSSANLLALSALTSPRLGDRRLKPGDEVLTAACAFPTTVNPIVQNNLTPVFLDIEVETGNVSPRVIEAAISSRTKAIFLAHTLGNPFLVDEVRRLADARGLWLIEDNCDALGSRVRGRFTGTYGHLATLSFYPPHHITLGEGGAVLVNDASLAPLVESFRDWGRDCWCETGSDNTCGKRFGWQLGTLPAGYDHKFIFSHRGYNLKVTDLQAAIGVEQLKKLPEFVAARRRNWTRLRDGLRDCEDVFILPRAEQDAEPSWFGFLLIVRPDAPFTRDEIVRDLETNRIATRMLFSGNITRHPSLADVPYRVHGALTNTDLVMNHAFWVGVYPGLTEPMLDHMIARIRAFVRGKQG